jgi:hypothetical protein
VNINLGKGNSVTIVMFAIRIVEIDVRHMSEFFTVGWNYINIPIVIQLH